MTSAAPVADILNSWKEIAAYLRRGVRTAQRWEADLGLPVRRPRGKDRSAVIALRWEIDQWLQTKPSGHEQIKPLEPSAEPRLDGGGWRFLMTEVATGLTFAGIAISARPYETEKIDRNTRNTHKAYNAVVKFRQRILMDEVAAQQLNSALRDLENVMLQLPAKSG